MSTVRDAALDELKVDLLDYVKATGKDAKWATYGRLRGINLNLRKLFFKEAPSISEINDAGYSVIVRPVIAEKFKAGEGYKGKSNYRSQGKKINRRAAAVRKELAVRRSSIKWLGNSLPVMKALSPGAFAGSASGRVFGRSRTKADRRGNIVGVSKGSFSDFSALFSTESNAHASGKVSRRKGDLEARAIQQSNDFVKRQVTARQGRTIGKHLKRVYKS